MREGTVILRTCPREKEVKELVERGQWPQVCATELRAHVGGCRSCGDLVLVTAAFQEARTEAAGEARIGSPGVLWWRAQLRRRNAAVERIGRPILGAQIFALAVNVALAVGFVVRQARHGFAWLAWLKHLPQTAAAYLGSLWPTGLFGSGFGSLLTPMVMISAAATLALLGGAVVYLASEKQ
jgi:hypothetical protein